MKMIILLLFLSIHVGLGADINEDHTPVNGHWNVTDKRNALCVKMGAAIRLEITYKTHNGSTRTTKIVSQGNEKVDSEGSLCNRSTTDLAESMVLRFSKDRVLTFNFTRDHNITGDETEQKWQLYNITFSFKYDHEDFPDAEIPGRSEEITSASPLNGIITVRGFSYRCSAADMFKITDQFHVTFYNLRVQAFMTGEDYGLTEPCTKDLIKIAIVVTAFVAVLVIISYIPSLVRGARGFVRRARMNTHVITEHDERRRFITYTPAGTRQHGPSWTTIL